MKRYRHIITLVIVVALALSYAFLMSNFQENQCERNGLGKWHFWTQVCEPLKHG